MIRVTFVLAYYRNPAMLAEQYRVWAGYPDDLKRQIEIRVIDDSSPEPAIDVPRPDGLPALTIGRLADVPDAMTPPWRQDAARNRGAHEAVGGWLFATDMDHVLPGDSVRALLGRIDVDGPVLYTFHRVDAPDLTPKRDKNGHLHPHPNTFAVAKTTYWQAGGYDEDACGIYGTDGPFLRCLSRASCAHVHLDAPVVRYPRDVIPDASTRTDRKTFRGTPEQRARLERKRAWNLPPSTLTIPYRQQYPEAVS